MKDEILGIFVTLFFASGFLVPGFIIHKTVSRFVTQRTENIQLFILRFLTYTLFTYALCFGWIFSIIRSKYYLHHPFITAHYAVFIIFIVPLIIGTAIGIFKQRLQRPISDFFSEHGISVLDHEHTAWGYQFCRLMSGDSYALIQVTMKDGIKHVGLFGNKSHASERTPDGDLYIEKLVKVKEDSSFEIIPTSMGILIKQEDILSLEFVSVTQDDPTNKETANAERKPSERAATDAGKGPFPQVARPATYDGQPRDHSREGLSRQRGGSNGGDSTSHATQRQEIKVRGPQPDTSSGADGDPSAPDKP